MDSLGIGNGIPASTSGASTPSGVANVSILGATASAHTIGITIGSPSTMTRSTTPPCTHGPYDHPTSDVEVGPSPGIIVKSIGELPISLHMDK